MILSKTSLIIYRRLPAITSERDTLALQKDLDILAQWASKWQMKFNISKCTLMRCTKSPNPIPPRYSLQGINLDESD